MQFPRAIGSRPQVKCQGDGGAAFLLDVHPKIQAVFGAKSALVAPTRVFIKNVRIAQAGEKAGGSEAHEHLTACGHADLAHDFDGLRQTGIAQTLKLQSMTAILMLIFCDVKAVVSQEMA